MSEQTNPYVDVPFDEIRSAIVGGVRRENVEALRSSAEFLMRQFKDAKCDSDGLSGCLRCQAVHLARSTLAALEGVQTVPELARAFVAQRASKETACGEAL